MSHGVGLTSECRQERAVLPIVTFVTLAEIQQQEDIYQHPDQRGGKHHLTVNKAPHEPYRCQDASVRSDMAREERPGSTAAMQQNTKDAVIPLGEGKHYNYRYTGSRGPHTWCQFMYFNALENLTQTHKKNKQKKIQTT